MNVVAQLNPEAVSLAARCLREGGVAALPTETVYGLMALWRDGLARERIYELKKRPAATLAALGEAFWPGPLTVVAEAAGGDTVGLRVPRHGLLLSILDELGEPLAATSANLSGQPPALEAESAVRDLAGEVDLLVDGGTVEVGEASTVVSVVGGELKVLRPGPISEAELRAALA
jgi:L-threonylcarbamoyladenylate synthase